MNRMNKITITRRFVLDAGHRVHNHEGKCRSLHGHRYIFHITCSAHELDSLGRIIDFSVVKNHVGAWLDEYWDHAMLLFHKDPICELYGMEGPLEEHKVFILSENPTIENLCSFLLEKSQSLLSVYEIDVIRVLGFETENCSACVEV